jgi:hypothetical protein
VAPDSAYFVRNAADAVYPLSAFAQYAKLAGWLMLHAAQVPALEGVVVTAWDAAAESTVGRAAAAWGTSAVLVRSDTQSETAASARGGFVVGLSQVADVARSWLKAGNALFLLEPASPYDDLYSVNFAPDPSWTTWNLEVVGPGFDAGDLKRGDVTPHERVTASIAGDIVTLSHRQLATAVALSASREIRRRKIATMLACEVDEVDEARAQRTETLFVTRWPYRPIPASLIGDIVQLATRIRPILVQHGYADEGVILSASVLNDDSRLVFWDVMWPHLRFTGSRPENRRSTPGE